MLKTELVEEQGGEEKQEDLHMTEYITAYDPIIKKRVLHVVRGGYAISTITGHAFPYRSR
jgi:hypothetical protein